MIYYLFIIILGLAAAVKNHLKNDSPYVKYAPPFLFAAFIVFGALRFEVGTDWFTYLKYFNNSVKLFHPEIFTSDYLFKLFQYLIKMLFDSYLLFVAGVFVVSFTLKYAVLRKYSNNISLSLLVYYITIFLYFDINAIRQGLALGLVFFSLRYILENDWKKYLLLCLAASLIHLSAVIFLPFYWISRIELSRRSYLLIICGALLIRLVWESFQFDPDIIGYMLPKEYLGKLKFYISDKYFGRPIDLFSVAVFQRALVFFSFLLLFDKIDINEKVKRLLINASFLSFALFVALSMSTDIATRLSFYFRIFEILLIPAFLAVSAGKMTKLSILLCIIVYCLAGLYRMLSITNGGLLPYDNLLLHLF
ncbi:MAG: EpsG family protein [Deltaproteobacteria bacterium]|nr:EpsG family protein [Deltaproteobacteria bacterium]